MKWGRSIETTLIWGVGAALAALSVLTATTTYRLVRRGLLGEFDYALISKARAIASLVQDKGNGEIEFDYSGEAMPEFAGKRANEFFEIRYADGRVLEKSESLGKYHFPHVINTKPLFLDIRLPDGRPGRAVCMAFHPTPDLEHHEQELEAHEPMDEDGRSSVTLTVTIARERSALNKRLSASVGGIVLGNLLLIITAVGVVHVIVRRVLRPLHEVADFAESVSPDALDARMPTEGLPDELAPIAQRLNQLLERIEAAFERERRYSSDVAHELRTPLAEIRTSLEVGLQAPEEVSSLQHGAQEALQAAIQAEELVSTLLLLAHAEHEAQLECLEDVSLLALWQSMRGPLEARSREHGVELVTQIDASFRMRARATLLAACLRNIIENAVDYSPPGSRIDVAVDAPHGKPQVIVRNQAPGLTPDDVLHMFEPFWRKDRARTDRAHSGLGLTITRSLCKLMGLDVSAALDAHGILTIAVVSADARFD